MTEVTANARGGGMLWGVAVLTTAVLFILQVVGVIHIAWILVFAPLIFAVGVSILLVIIALIIMGIALGIAAVAPTGGSRKKIGTRR